MMRYELLLLQDLTRPVAPGTEGPVLCPQDEDFHRFILGEEGSGVGPGGMAGGAAAADEDEYNPEEGL